MPLDSDQAFSAYEEPPGGPDVGAFIHWLHCVHMSDLTLTWDAVAPDMTLRIDERSDGRRRRELVVHVTHAKANDLPVRKGGDPLSRPDFWPSILELEASFPLVGYPHRAAPPLRHVPSGG
jgi:hypothetical protein